MNPYAVLVTAAWGIVFIASNNLKIFNVSSGEMQLASTGKLPNEHH